MRPLSELQFDYPKKLGERGIAICPGFLTEPELEALNKEITDLLERPSINGAISGIFHTRGYDHREVLFPASSIHSINLLELALDVRDLFVREQPELASQNLKLTNLEIFSEEGNREPLFWHTDNRNGMVRAMIYLTGGEDRSGKFQFMVGTHKRDYYVEHKLTDDQIKKLSHTIFDCSGAPGALMLFDSVGFHAKKVCIENRRTIMIEFQPEGAAYKKSNIVFSSFNLSDRVMKNIEFLDNGFQVDGSTHGLDHYIKNPPALPVRLAVQALWFSIRVRLKVAVTESRLYGFFRKNELLKKIKRVFFKPTLPHPPNA